LSKLPLVTVVDDDASVREATRDLLESHGYVTATFASAEEFLQSRLLRDTTCLVTDVRMGGLSGVELQQRLIDGGHRIPVIFMTAIAEEHTRAVALRLGAHGFLTKPVSGERLIGCLEGALEQHGPSSSER
jgi:FixJ family two-component response regulator